MFLKLFTNFTGNYLCWSLFSDKVAALRFAPLLKRMLQHRCFPVKFKKFLRTPLLYLRASASVMLLKSASSLFFKSLLELAISTIYLQCSVKGVLRFLAIMTQKYEYLRELTWTYWEPSIMFNFICQLYTGNSCATKMQLV